MDEVQLTTQYALVKDPRRMPRLINHPDRNPPEQRAGRTYAVVGKGGATVRAAASLRSPVVGTVERGGKVDVVEERRARAASPRPSRAWVSGQGPRAARDGPGRGGRDGHHGVDRRGAAPGRPYAFEGPGGRPRPRCSRATPGNGGAARASVDWRVLFLSSPG